MGATLVAAAQVLVYIGAISVLILFAIMLTQSKSGPARLVFHHQAWAAAHRRRSCSALLLIMQRRCSRRGRSRCRSPSCRAPGTSPTLLFEDYVLAFEVISVLLLAAVIGGIFLARRDDDARSPARHADRGRRHRPRSAGRTREGGGAVSHSLDAYLILACAPVRHRHVRLPRPAQRHRDAHVRSS